MIRARRRRVARVTRTVLELTRFVRAASPSGMMEAAEACVSWSVCSFYGTLLEHGLVHDRVAAVDALRPVPDHLQGGSRLSIEKDFNCVVKMLSA